MELSAVLLLISLTGGYGFSVNFLPSKFRSSREAGHRIYLRSVFYTFCVVLYSLLLYIIVASYEILDLRLPTLPLTGNNFTTLVDLAIALSHEQKAWRIILCATPFLGPILALLVNQFFNAYPNGQLKTLKAVIKNRDFERLILRSLESSIPMLITLSSGKVYVGWAVRAPDPTEERKFLRILPLISGYRSPTFHKVIFTTFYADVYEKMAADNPELNGLDHLESEDFEVVIPTDKITSCHLYDVAAQSHFGEFATRFSKTH